MLKDIFHVVKSKENIVLHFSELCSWTASHWSVTLEEICVKAELNLVSRNLLNTGNHKNSFVLELTLLPLLSAFHET